MSDVKVMGGKLSFYVKSPKRGETRHSQIEIWGKNKT